MKYNFRTPHSKDTQTVAYCARAWRNYADLSEKERKAVLACHHWKKYLEQRGWVIPGWVSSNIARYLRMVYEGKRSNDWALELKRKEEEGLWSIS